MDLLAGTIISKINNFKNDFCNYCEEEKKRGRIFLNWIIRKFHYFNIEKMPLMIPEDAIPKKLNQYEYTRCNEETKKVVDLYYKAAGNGCYYRDTKIKITDEDKKVLAERLILRKGIVVWIDFGFNVGREFGGHHPAIILKNTGGNLIVAPLSTVKPEKKFLNSDVPIESNDVFDLPLRERFVNVNRIQPVSTYRIMFEFGYGRVKGKKVEEVLKCLKNEWNLPNIE